MRQTSPGKKKFEATIKTNCYSIVNGTDTHC